MFKKATHILYTYGLHFILLVSFVAMIGSLYFSDIKGYPPCVLCWYQRIAMYSLIPITFISLYRGDKKAYHLILPIAFIGWFIALYHNLLYIGIIKNEEFCSYGISCTAKYVDYFGFITIPLLSFTAFSIIILLGTLYRRWLRKVI